MYPLTMYLLIIYRRIIGSTGIIDEKVTGSKGDMSLY